MHARIKSQLLTEATKQIGLYYRISTSEAGEYSSEEVKGLLQNYRYVYLNPLEREAVGVYAPCMSLPTDFNRNSAS